MNEPSLGQPPSTPLRLWPGIALAALLWLAKLGLPLVSPDQASTAMIAGAAGAVAILIWWTFFSRAPWTERLIAMALVAAALAATPLILDKSIATGMMGLMFYFYASPVVMTALVAWAALAQNLSTGPRRAALALAIFAGAGAFALLRTGGISGSAASDFAWRWTPTREEQLLAKTKIEPVVTPPPPAPAVKEEAPAPKTEPAAAATTKAPVASPAPPKPEVRQVANWPGFRGPLRDGVVRNIKIKTDWSATPPKEVWRREIGPGWSSVALQNGLLYTQEQRGESEIVSCYKADTGEPVWTHRDPVRFWESNAGAGPRSTPTLSGNRVFTFGATGLMNALHATTGAKIWSRNAATELSVKVPEWGFSSSPLVHGNSVIVAVSGHLAAYDASSGAPLWSVDTGSGSYSSPHLVTVDGVAHVVLLNGSGVTSVAPMDGKVLWKHTWSGFTTLQPALVSPTELLVTSSGAAGGLGTRRIALSQSPTGWNIEERWTSNGLKPYFNDMVVHKNHAFGFDGSILSCINLQDGRRSWKGGRYGHGQMVVLRDQDLLLVLSEEGEVALVSAKPGEFTEVAKFKAIEGKTWNHPVVAGGVVYVRNGQEMAAFRVGAE